ncbi:hypothetical protein AB6A40_007348 [Gnathostoma spinigerum]|uniref:SSD domain-containing protein n=1 Tax=Gnathostoma spinigerum TaxID=75299 RepID=A0ABD6EKZ1_9BILA
MKRESGLGGGYQVVIQVPRRADKNILTRDGLLEHVSVMKEIAEFRVEVAGENWTLADICFKPPTPEVSNQSMGANYIKIIDQIIPCVWITPIDCFWEGAKALGPHPPVNASDMATAMQFMTSLPSKDTFSWADINPQLVMEELNEFFNLGNLDSFFKRAQIGSGYLDRWCIDPLDHECPVEAPNHFRFCDLIPKFLSYAAEHNFEVPVDPEFLKWEEAKKLRDAMSVENLFGLFGRKKRETKAYDRSEKVLKDVRLGSSVHSPMIPVGNESASPSDHTIPSITAKLQGDKHQATSRSFVHPENTTLPIPSSSTVSLLTPATKTETEDPFEVTLREQKTKEPIQTTLLVKDDYPSESSRLSSAIDDNSNNNDKIISRSSAGKPQPLILDSLDDLFSDEEEGEESENATRCRKYARPFADWMRANHEKWKEFLNEEELPVFPDYGQVLSEGCHGFARGVMSWPQDLIVGGIGKSQNGKIQSAQALQSVFLVSSPNDVYLRFKDNRKRYLKKSLNSSNWNIEMAQKVISTWQRNFTHNLYNHKWNFELDTDSGVYAEHRRIHPLASTSIADMLEEFCQFNYTIIFIGYFLMLVYAMHAQMKCHGCLLAVDSCMGLAFAGVVTVTFASISGLGLATWFGIEFNAATTQIVPFLTLGIGVDNMFLLLHNYHGILENVNRNEIGELMKETGMSVVMSSVNNILSFLAGTVLPIPALRSFCAQSSVLLSFNLIAILTIYPAIISIDLQRRKRIRRDICCWAVATEATVSSEDSFFTKPQIQEKKTIGANESSYNNLYACAEPTYEIEDEVKPWTLQAFLRNYYVPLLSKDSSKLFILFFCSLMLLASLRGMYDATYGLELSDVLPDNTAPAAFLKARDRYFSFYPMFAVLKGPGIDYARSQHIIDRYRMSIGK